MVDSGKSMDLLNSNNRTKNPNPMKTKLALLVSGVLLSNQLCTSQTNESVAEDFTPSSLNQPSKQYPQVNSERRVRARVAAPQATSVLLDIGAVKYPLTKDSSGGWAGES